MEKLQLAGIIMALLYLVLIQDMQQIKIGIKKYIVIWNYYIIDFNSTLLEGSLLKKINFKIKNVRLAFTLLIILAFIVLLLYYHFVLSPSFAKSNFTNQMIEIADENENSIFNVQKILLYSSANAISNSKDQSLKDMSICQYTDLSIYIDNSQSSSEFN